MYRDNHGRFAKKDYVKGVAVFVGLVLFWAMIYFGEVYLPNWITANKVEASNAEVITVEVDSFPEKIDRLKNEVVADLQKCELGGYKESDGIIIFDANNEASIGPLQFQRDTVVHYYKALYGKTISRQDAVAIAIDGEKARTLAKDIIFKTKNGVAKDWVNCSKWHGLQARVDVIKELEN